MKPCAICNNLTNSKCSNCNQVSYCSILHQKEDWKNHKQNCFPFKIERNNILGRYLVATRNIKPFEIVLREEPLVTGPSQITQPVCLGCLNAIEPNDYIECKHCGWPLCGLECSNKVQHVAECKLTRERGRKVYIKDFTNPHPLYHCLSTIRCLLLKETNSRRWELFNELESLEDSRRGSMQWKADLQSVGKFIPKFFATDKYDEDLIMRTIGILQINGHEVPISNPAHVAVFYKAAFLEHSCQPNLAKSFSKEGHILLWSPAGIKKNSHLSICYSDAVWGTLDRQRHLLHTKLFKCTCNRCLDVTEFGSNYDGIKCDVNMCDGILLPSNEKDWNKNWRCNTCNKFVKKGYVDSILEKAVIDLQAMDKTVDNAIKYINHYEKYLSPNHYHLCEVKIHLVQLIGKDMKELLETTDEHLELKIRYSKELVELYKILAPCETRMLGTLCFELHSAIAENTRRFSLKTNLSPTELLEESLCYADYCVKYLQYESDIFIEGHICKQAKLNRDALRLVIHM